MMHPEELTLAEVFKASGYATAMIGKWHLGDNYPCRPEDQGFDHTVRTMCRSGMPLLTKKQACLRRWPSFMA